MQGCAWLRMTVQDCERQLNTRSYDRQLWVDSVEKLFDHGYGEVFEGPLTPNRCSRAACRAI
ncbi:protein of unknown function [Burkholderia multivorans]